MKTTCARSAIRSLSSRVSRTPTTRRSRFLKAKRDINSVCEVRGFLKAKRDINSVCEVRGFLKAKRDINSVCEVRGFLKVKRDINNVPAQGRGRLLHSCGAVLLNEARYQRWLIQKASSAPLS
ncbi:hypothetical protein [Sorangium sp. So ce1000]|uniref:hypothetical protein n=1 Tax=Sorangium sp. So ce1000 TaxID=3133325 RepID=UPI003F5EFA1B